MIFRQLFDQHSCTYTYLLASRDGGEALLIDPVLDHLDQYLQLLNELNVRLVLAVDTHVHADHITALGRLRDEVNCPTLMGEFTRANCVSLRLKDGEKISVDGIELRGMYTPGHTDDSFSFVMRDRVFTGDALLIRGTGRTDFQNGDPIAAYDSLFNKILKLPEETFVYPAHDYKGWSCSTVDEERRCNPRLQVTSAAQYAEIMNNLNLPDPAMMDIAVPANLACGRI